MSSVLWAEVDFGEGEGVLLPSLTVEGMAPGLSVVLFDDEGNTCEGTVERVDERLTWIRPDPRTWTPGSYSAPPVVWRPQASATSPEVAWTLGSQESGPMSDEGDVQRTAGRVLISG
jgi:hypothetical protein